jgi:hypothetical protein
MRPVGLSLSVGSLARMFAAGRVVVGATMLARPELLARGMRVDAATARRTGWLGQMVGVRDLALGVGTLHALTRGGAARPWLLLAALADAVDAAALAEAVRRKQVAAPPALLTVGVAAGSVAVHLAAAREVS